MSYNNRVITYLIGTLIMILYINRICSMKKLNCILALFWFKYGHYFSVSSCWTMQSPWLTCLTTTGFAVCKLERILFFEGGSKGGSNWSSLWYFSMLDHDIQLIVEIYCWDLTWTWQLYNGPLIWTNSLTKWQFNQKSVLYFCSLWFLKFWSWLCILNKVHDLVFLVIQENENCCWQCCWQQQNWIV